MSSEKDLKHMLRLMTDISQDLLDQLINATEGFDDPFTEEEISEYEAFIDQAKEFLK